MDYSTQEENELTGAYNRYCGAFYDIVREYVTRMYLWDKINDSASPNGGFHTVSFHVSIEICSGITSGRVLNGELLYTMILEVNLFANKLTSRIIV